ncbi:MFS transporter [Brevibacillus reuszeri]|uniref:MFS transporter n=1 Tax=Brevibacillus reuszeri TaxID=54915 RepID=A0A0K9YUH0_9BACL|nr:MFS transporter [Brevibacillus reuszeri]KNB72343.1 MFS transporter [Brevibacillus reuszeri]MED1861005.1 MFS transporter [Brevibacillus reuszeri]GED70481.1 MFS transporter [Brevibacillus reuszeri]
MGNEQFIRSSNIAFITGILFWCTLAVVSCVYLTIPLIAVFEDVFKVSSSQAAWSSSAFSLAFAGGGLLFGVLSDRFGRKKMMLSGLVLLTVITPLIGNVDSFSWLVALRALQGLAASMFPPSVLAYAMEMFPFERRATIIGFISTAFLMATIVGQIYSSFVVLKLGDWSYVFYLLSTIYGISSILLTFFIPNDKIQQTKGSFVTSFLRVGDIFKRKGLPLCYIVSASLFISLVGFFATLGSYLSSPIFGLSHQDILWVRAIGILGMAVSPFAGRLVTKIGVKNVLWCGLILAGSGLGLLGLSLNIIYLISMSVVFVLGIAIALPSLISLIGHMAGEIRAIAVSFHMFMVFIGASLGSILSIYLIDVGGYLFTFEILAGLLFLSMIVPFFIRLEERHGLGKNE